MKYNQFAADLIDLYSYWFLELKLYKGNVKNLMPLLHVHNVYLSPLGIKLLKVGPVNILGAYLMHVACAVTGKFKQELS